MIDIIINKHYTTTEDIFIIDELIKLKYDKFDFENFPRYEYLDNYDNELFARINVKNDKVFIDNFLKDNIIKSYYNYAKFDVRKFIRDNYTEEELIKFILEYCI